MLRICFFKNTSAQTAFASLCKPRRIITSCFKDFRGCFSVISNLINKEFFEFKQKPENSERKFVQVEDKNLSSKYSVIFIEANKELYKKCNAEHSEDMRRKEEKKKYPRKFVSLDKLRGDDSDTDNHERYSDNRWEEEYILDKLQAEELHKAIGQLTEKEKRTFEVITFAVLQGISERELAVSLGIPQKTLNNRKRKIFEKIRKKLAQTE